MNLSSWLKECAKSFKLQTRLVENALMVMYHPKILPLQSWPKWQKTTQQMEMQQRQIENEDHDVPPEGVSLDNL